MTNALIFGRLGVATLRVSRRPAPKSGLVLFLGCGFPSRTVTRTPGESLAGCGSLRQNFVVFKHRRATSSGVAARCRSSRRRKCILARLQGAPPHPVVVRLDLAAALRLQAHVEGFDDVRVMVLRRSRDQDPAGFDFVMPRFEEGMRYSLVEVGAIHEMLHKLVVALVHEIQRLGAAFKDRFTTYELGD